MKKVQLLILALLFGGLLTQGFQCTSSEMSTARNAYSLKEYDKAIANYEKELAKTPNNTAAMVELANVYLDFEYAMNHPEKVSEAAKLLIKAKTTTPPPNMKVDLNKYETVFYNGWIGLFNQGTQQLREMYNAEPGSDEMKRLGNDAIATYNDAITLYPDNPDNYVMLGSVYSAMNNNPKALENFEMYNTKLKREIDFFVEKGLTIGATPEELVAKLGKPEMIYPFTQILRGPQDKDTITLYQYKVKNSKEPLLVFTKHNSKVNRTGIMGWRFTENTNPFSFDITSTYELARINYDEKNYDKSLDYLNKLRKLDPTNPIVNQFMVQIYEAQGKPELAVKEIERLTSEQPNNPNFKAQYGDMLLKAKKYDEAIVQYEAALKIKPDYNEVKKVLGSAYKNKAADLQKIEIDKYTADNNYQIKESVYKPYLDKSKVLFEEFIAKPESRDDYEVLIELADIYASNKENAKFTSALDKLITLKDTVPEVNKAYYYASMIRLIDRSGNTEKYKSFIKEYEDMIK